MDPAFNNKLCIYAHRDEHSGVSITSAATRRYMCRDTQDVPRDGCRRGMGYAGPRHCPRVADPNIQPFCCSSLRTRRPPYNKTMTTGYAFGHREVRFSLSLRLGRIPAYHGWADGAAGALFVPRWLLRLPLPWWTSPLPSLRTRNQCEPQI
ncbi:hypothetical protein HYPSUDRAFT_730249 [Hypholoma sublateritium FD-334 SS-4]|uniref:Uncharacterized protein n=1 Tax=Hypholoma sublateritium (strain FD-334 SS-4) TaxID=945553 RepID=A0A0D2MD03_HYPSF|nr:hypothetical protein HYPSUDRAFT_730249 [Hypholoma sublateritium FD-334 SS-4]